MSTRNIDSGPGNASVGGVGDASATKPASTNGDELDKLLAQLPPPLPAVDAAFFARVVQVSDVTAGHMVANLAIQSDLPALSSVLDLLEQRLADPGSADAAGKNALDYAAWLWREVSVGTLDGTAKHQAFGRRVVGSLTMPSLYIRPAQALASALWPEDPVAPPGGIRSYTDARPLNHAQRVFMKRAAAALYRLQELAKHEGENSRPFDTFFARCLEGVRDADALGELLREYLPALDAKCQPRITRLQTSDMLSQSEMRVELALVPFIALNPHALTVFFDAARDFGASHPALGKAMEGLARDSMRADGAVSVPLAKAYVTAAARELSPASDAPLGETPLLNIMRRILAECENEEMRARILHQWLLAAMREMQLPSVAKQCLVERLWSWRDDDFPAQMQALERGSPIGLRRQLVENAVCFYFPAIAQAFGDVLAEEIDSASAACRGQLALKTSHYAAAMAELPDFPQRFRATLQLLARHGGGPEQPGDSGEALLHVLARNAKDKPAKLQAMLLAMEEGADPNAKNARGRTCTTELPKELRPQWVNMRRSWEAKREAERMLTEMSTPAREAAP